MIKLYLSNFHNGTVFVWNAEDIYNLRKHHRIIGALIGVHPYLPAQIKRRHVPMKLMLEEVKLLLDKGLAELHHSPDEPPNEAVKKQILETRDKLYDEQIALSKEHRKNEILAKCKDPELAQKKSEQVTGIAKEDAHFQIFTECPWKENKLTDLPSRYPATIEDKVKYEVFKNLWERKFYITCGTKFGGDFLVYAGDPYIFHSLYIVVCLPPSKKIQGLDIVVYGRLGNQVKKTVVLASLNDKGEVEYISIEYVPEITK